MSKKYPRDMVGYGKKSGPIFKRWPNNSKLALQIVVNYEEGGENCVLHGDKHSETFLSEIIGAQPVKGRNMNMESLYEYGSRRGFWRIYKLFMEREIPFTIFGVATALEKNKDVCEAIKKSYLKKNPIEVACHGLKWIDYQNIPKQIEKKHMKMAIKSIQKTIGKRPLGWYRGSDGQDLSLGINYFNNNNVIVSSSIGFFQSGEENITERIFESYSDYLRGPFPSGEIDNNLYFKFNFSYWWENKISLSSGFYCSNNIDYGNEINFKLGLHIFQIFSKEL